MWRVFLLCVCLYSDLCIVCVVFVFANMYSRWCLHDTKFWCVCLLWVELPLSFWFVCLHGVCVVVCACVSVHVYFAYVLCSFCVCDLLVLYA